MFEMIQRVDVVTLPAESGYRISNTVSHAVMRKHRQWSSPVPLFLQFPSTYSSVFSLSWHPSDLPETLGFFSESNKNH
jgi:hypothetical protein